ncbi:dienelactone hydrolase [Paecilomyces variotii No. 5]|uniref:Dienelactone hydrolase n=1 Tax=Byssochlamys spectabilis (strain No. 5 / NBRC 109023) TaxID=1356009 RepID=V5FI98_BYSSN|nr:dienelactone hydrolase [Paecilomyces variotii No. 5]
MTCEACRTLPPVVPEGYAAKGRYETLSGFKTYVAGPADATVGIIGIYDIFGLAIQTIQGADLLASRLNAVVLVPDLFHGDAARHKWFHPDTQEKKDVVAAFISSKAAFPPNVGALWELVGSSKITFSRVQKWGAYGLCWGGKVVVLSSGSNTPFAATAQTHPAQIDKADAEKLTIPHLVLASKDEAADAVAEYARIIDNNGIGGHVEIYPSMWHGWMGARARLDNEHARAEFSRGYGQLADFFGKYFA